MKIKIDQIKNTVEYVDPVDGKIKKGELVKFLSEVEVKEVESDLLAKKDLQIIALEACLKHLESNVTTMSVEAWEKYKAISL